MRNKSIAILFVVGVFFLSVGLSYLFFSNKTDVGKTIIKSNVPLKTGGKYVGEDDLPKTEECPLNGAYYSKKRKDWWDKHRPLGVMIENHQESRPQSGLTSADIVYEAVAEGGITRFLVMFYCQDADPIGPVRSARTYFMDFVSEYGQYPLYAHVGGANTTGPANALGQIGDYGWTGYNDLNQFSIGFPTFWRDYDRLEREVTTEHTMYSATSKLWDYAVKKRKITNKDKEGNSWDENFENYIFKNDVKAQDRGSIKNITLEFWERYNDYFANWKYNKDKNIYQRNNGGSPHIDKNINKPIQAKTIVVLFMEESNANDGYEDNAHLLYDTKGTGKASIFLDGKQIKGTWKKKSRKDRTLLFDEKGSVVKFNRGLIWFAILPTTATLTVK